ncbi:MAG: NUDIX domain-containing protein [Candidatus Micrarchaeota archaeon]|nr:NUDIX domain-containing protein [Candidatus Micrarchaeota archaeon]MDE1834357.1 NUDIX domain-containing protein [Candidatus Micrarchaeota archaeon]MDE1859705.1 NUDIX domain-containing protein [Candidatus Micrarchaeota archaeon]
MPDKIDKLGWIYLKDKKILCTKSKGKDIYYMPGGKREAGESDEQALLREIKEELSIDLIPNTLKFVEAFEAQAHAKPMGTMVKITCYTGDFKGKIKPASEIETASWLTYADRDKIALTGQLIFDYLKGKDLLG